MITIHWCVKCGKIHDKPEKYYDKEVKKEVFKHICGDKYQKDTCSGELRMISLTKKDILGMYLEDKA